MAIKNRIINTLFAPRLRQIDRFIERPAEVQQRQLQYLLGEGEKTAYGRQYGMKHYMSQSDFMKRVPVVDYDAFSPWIDRIRLGEPNVVWSKSVEWFAKSSGTTGAKSKYIPVTRDGLRQSHIKGPTDILAVYCHAFPFSRVLDGKMLTLGGSKRLEHEGDSILAGDLSSILIDNTPRWASWLRMPSKRTALLADFDEKVRRICEESVGQQISSFTGVPSWNLVMLNRVLDYTGKNNILEVWPHMELFVHGGMNFAPYRAQYNRLIPSVDMKYMETYNASEGFFALATEPYTNEMLLMLDYGTYYEFIPLADLQNPTKAIPLEGVKKGVNYAVIITSSNGLWRYMIGDTVEFTSLSPYKIKITGRTKMFVNAFGEEIIIDNADRAIAAACHKTGSEVSEYTMAPIYMEGKENGAHQWMVEFRHKPESLDQFTDSLDKALQELNSDYEAKRRNNTTLQRPTVTVVEQGTFMEWLRSEGKFGGQCKVPRLSNDRRYVDSLIEFERRNLKP